MDISAPKISVNTNKNTTKPMVNKKYTQHHYCDFSTTEWHYRHGHQQHYWYAQWMISPAHVGLVRFALIVFTWSVPAKVHSLGGRSRGNPQGEKTNHHTAKVCEEMSSICHDGQAVGEIASCRNGETQTLLSIQYVCCSYLQYMCFPNRAVSHFTFHH